MPDISPDTPIVILTGAGISRESGLETFRDKDGIWAKVRLEDVATPEAFARDPDHVNQFYNHRRHGLLDDKIQPNDAHRALARLQEYWLGDVLLVTQNIDDLHERGGSDGVLHMHGELLKSTCTHCNEIHPCRDDLTAASACPGCGQTGGMRPWVVWFGEMPHEMDRIYSALQDCGLFISIGTSGNVYPAAGFVQEALLSGAHTVELNLEPSAGSELFAETHHGPATKVVSEYVERLLASL